MSEKIIRPEGYEKNKNEFWAHCINFGDFLSNLGDRLLIKSLDKLNEMHKAEWIRSYDQSQD